MADKPNAYVHRDRLWRWLGNSYSALALIGVGGAGILFVLSATLFVSRPFAEPAVRFLLPLLMALVEIDLEYEPDYYCWVAGDCGLVGLAWLLGFLWMIASRPGQNARIDRNLLLRRRGPVSHGAPLEPE